jgi:hypothetical protein
VAEQDGAGRLAGPDNADTDAAGRKRRPTRVVGCDTAAVIVEDVDGLGRGRRGGKAEKESGNEWQANGQVVTSPLSS